MRALLPVVLVLLLGLLAFLFLGDRPEAPRDEGDGGTAVEADHPVAAEELDAGSAPAGEGLQREGDDGAPGSGRSADGGMRWGAPLVPGEDGLVLAVVDGDTGDAVPGAVIQLIPEGRNVRAGDPAPCTIRKQMTSSSNMPASVALIHKLISQLKGTSPPVSFEKQESWPQDSLTAGDSSGSSKSDWPISALSLKPKAPKDPST